MIFDLFRGLRRVITGRVVRKIDTAIGGGVKISLCLKEEKDANLYVVLERHGGNMHTYDPMDLTKFEDLFAAMEDIRRAATATAGAPSRHPGGTSWPTSF